MSADACLVSGPSQFAIAISSIPMQENLMNEHGKQHKMTNDDDDTSEDGVLAQPNGAEQHREALPMSLNCIDTPSEVAIAIVDMQELMSEHGKQQEMTMAHGRDIASGDGVLAQPSTAQQQDALPMSFNCPVSESWSNGNSSAMGKEAAGAEGKKLQYVLRSNPKRSRRFLDPDYNSTLPFASASTTTTISSSTGETPAASPAPSPALMAPFKKPTSTLFSEKARACTECGKEFHSWKALFGHMRCHPERQWRGIQPPSSFSSIPPKFKPSLATKRGGNAIHLPSPDREAQCSPILDESDTESIEAAYMHERDEESPAMAEKRSKPPLQNDGQFPSPGESEFVMEKCSKLRHLQNNEQFSSPTESEVIMDEQAMADCLVMLAFAADKDDDEAAERPSNGHLCPGNLRWKGHSAEPKKAIKKRSWDVCMQRGNNVSSELEDGGTGDSCKSKFQCTSCKKTFKSHQALGGHRASHKKVKGCFARTIKAPEDTICMPAKALQDTDMASSERITADMASAVGEAKEDEHKGHESKMRMGQFLQFSMTCHEKLDEEPSYSFAIATDLKKQLKHQSSSCSSSSSVIAGTTAAAGVAAAGPLHTHELQKIHQCTVCRRVFSTGQALGGHKRCHWGSSPASNSSQKGTLSQDSDGRCEETPHLCLQIAIPDRMSATLSRKDSRTFTMDEARISGPSENEFEQRSIAEDYTKDAQSWMVGGYAIAEESGTIASSMMQKIRECHDDGSYEGGENPLKHSLHNDGHLTEEGAIASPMLQRSGHGDDHYEGHYEEARHASTVPAEIRLAEVGLEHDTRSLLPKEELILDLNLPAPAEEEDAEEPSVLSKEISFHEPPCPCIFSFLAPAASKNFLCADEGGYIEE